MLSEGSVWVRWDMMRLVVLAREVDVANCSRAYRRGLRRGICISEVLDGTAHAGFFTRGGILTFEQVSFKHVSEVCVAYVHHESSASRISVRDDQTCSVGLTILSCFIYHHCVQETCISSEG